MTKQELLAENDQLRTRIRNLEVDLRQAQQEIRRNKRILFDEFNKDKHNRIITLRWLPLPACLAGSEFGLIIFVHVNHECDFLFGTYNDYHNYYDLVVDRGD